MVDSAAYVLALLDTQGVGIVTASRLVEHFRSADELESCPLEQVIVRLGRVANAEKLAKRLQREIRDRIDVRRQELVALKDTGIDVISTLDADWPRGLRDLPRSERPLVLYTYGNLKAMQRKRVAYFGAQPISDQSLQHALSVLKRILVARALPCCGVRNDFDSAICRAAAGDHGGAAILLASAGLRKIGDDNRSFISDNIRAGGMVVSPFDMHHGPFAHDDQRRALIQAALSDVCVFVEPNEGTSEIRALEWAVGLGRPCFQVGGEALSLPLHRLNDDIDLEWLMVALAAVDDAPNPNMASPAASRP